ncbi:GIY-YIG nuclease family protein [Patescibacteria group bacterium]
MYFVYVLKSESEGRKYVGLSSCVDRRIDEHNKRYNRSTKSGVPWKLIHVEICKNRKKARILEKYFKSGFGREIVTEIESNLTS